MKNSIQSLVFALYVLCAVTAEASQLVPIEASKLQDLADIVLVGMVETIERDTENTIPKYLTDYDIVTVEVAFVPKGTVASKEVKIRLATRGNKAFDPALTKQTTATFFLRKAKDGFLITAYPGSVAIFPGRFDKTPTKVADQIGTLVERLSKSHTWNNGAFPKLDTPKDASAKDVIAAYCKMSSFQDGSRISELTVLEERTVNISSPLPDAYIAAKCKTDHGPMIFLLQYQEKPGQWWVKQYDAPAED